MKLLFSSVSPQLSWIQIQSQPARQAVQYNNHTSQVIIKHHFTSLANHPPNKQTKAVAVTVQFLLSFASNTIYYYFHNSNQYPSLCTTRSNLHSIVSSPHTLLPNWSCTKCLTIDETIFVKQHLSPEATPTTLFNQYHSHTHIKLWFADKCGNERIRWLLNRRTLCDNDNKIGFNFVHFSAYFSLKDKNE